MALAGTWTCGPSEHCLHQPCSPTGAPGLSTPGMHPKQSFHRRLGRRTLERPEERYSWKPQTGHSLISKNSRAEGWALDCQTEPATKQDDQQDTRQDGYGLYGSVCINSRRATPTCGVRNRDGGDSAGRGGGFEGQGAGGTACPSAGFMGLKASDLRAGP